MADIDAVTEETERVAEPAAQTRPSWRWRVVGLAGALLAILLPVILWNTGPYGPLALPPPPGPAAVPRPAATDPDGTPDGRGSARLPAHGPVPASAGTSAAPGTRPGSRSASQPGSPPVPAALAASYATIGTGALGVGGLRGRVTISNPGQVTVTGWTVALRLPSGETVTAATGAAFVQRGSAVTFTPDPGTAAVPGPGSVRFTFDVSGLLAGAPTDCAIDGRPCAATS